MHRLTKSVLLTFLFGGLALTGCSYDNSDGSLSEVELSTVVSTYELTRNYGGQVRLTHIGTTLYLTTDCVKFGVVTVPDGWPLPTSPANTPLGISTFTGSGGVLTPTASYYRAISTLTFTDRDTGKRIQWVVLSGAG
jgi:hypothetical protein